MGLRERIGVCTGLEEVTAMMSKDTVVDQADDLPGPCICLEDEVDAVVLDQVGD